MIVVVCARCHVWLFSRSHSNSNSHHQHHSHTQSQSSRKSSSTNHLTNNGSGSHPRKHNEVDLVGREMQKEVVAQLTHFVPLVCRTREVILVQPEGWQRVPGNSRRLHIGAPHQTDRVDLQAARHSDQDGKLSGVASGERHMLTFFVNETLISSSLTNPRPQLPPPPPPPLRPPPLPLSPRPTATRTRPPISLLPRDQRPIRQPRLLLRRAKSPASCFGRSDCLASGRPTWMRSTRPSRCPPT